MSFLSSLPCTPHCIVHPSFTPSLAWGPFSDLSKAIDAIFPLKTAPDRMDHSALFPHVSARNLLDHAVVQLPVVRYRGFRLDPPPVTLAAVPQGLTAPPPGAFASAATAATTGVAEAAAAAAAAAASAAWRLQQRLEFIQFEERVRRVSGDTTGVSDGGESAPAAASGWPDGQGGGTNEATAAVPGGGGGGGGAGRGHNLGGHDVENDREDGLDSNLNGKYGGGDSHRDAMGGDSVRRGTLVRAASAASAAPVAAAKRLVVVLADYLEDKTTIGMVIVDQPGTGMTTTLLGFLDWYCRGEAAGGRQV